MASPDIQKPLNSIEEVAAVLSTVLEEAKTRMGQERIPTYTDTHWGLEKAGYNKGLIVRKGSIVDLNNIAVPGMTPTEALEAGLTQVLGVPQKIPADAVERNLYVVQFDPVLSPSHTPKLKIGKIDRTDEFLAQAIARYEEVLADPDGHVWQSVFSGAGNDGKTPQQAAREDLAYLRILPGNILPLFIWTSSSTSTDNVFEASELKEDLTFHLIEMPFPPAVEVEAQGETVRSSVREVTSS